MASRERRRVRWTVLEFHRYWTTRDCAANVRLCRLEVLGTVEAGVFPPRVGPYDQDCPVRSRCWTSDDRSGQRFIVPPARRRRNARYGGFRLEIPKLRPRSRSAV